MFFFDSWVQSKEELVLRGFNLCVIDEVDSILIDEALITPLIISWAVEKPSEHYIKLLKLQVLFSVTTTTL